MKQTKSRLESRNYQKSLVTFVIGLIFAFASGQGAGIDVLPETVTEAIFSGDIMVLVTLAINELWVSATKIYQNYKENGGLKYDFLKSDNFISFVVVFVVYTSTVCLGDATTGIIVGAVVQTLNMIAHFANVKVAKSIADAFNRA